MISLERLKSCAVAKPVLIVVLSPNGDEQKTNEGKKEMAQANYRQIEKLLATRTPFSGNSCRAFLETDGTYEVYSYSTLIAVAKGDEIKFNERKYSVTTSRLQNLIRRAWGL